MNGLTSNVQYGLPYPTSNQSALLDPPSQAPLLQDMSLDYPPFPLIRVDSMQTTLPPREDEGSKAPIRITRPPNSYLLFNKKMRKILKEQDPTMNVGEISKQISDRWKKITKEEKDTYVKEAKRLKEEQRALHPNSMYIRRSKAELREAGKSGAKEEDAMDKRLKKGKRRSKNPGVPKHPLSAYMWYLNQVRPKAKTLFPRSHVGMISKYCAQKWYTMTEEEKTPWTLKAQADKERYAREMQLYALQNDHELGRGTRQKYRHALVATATAVANTDRLLESSLFNKYDPALLITAPASPSSIFKANASLASPHEDGFVHHT
ncbi:high mobility group box domain-containing protein [Sporodiniella umbellata]|nr:high mobility group box domain-containing protein [Sporodiniella umbellata]